MKMVVSSDKKVKTLVVDTTAFIQNAPLQEVAENIVTVEDVVTEITSKRQLRRLCVLPYELVQKNVDPESVRVVTEFSKKTGDYASLSAIDIKVIALTYQLERENVGTEHLREKPVMAKTVKLNTRNEKAQPEMTADVTGFYVPGKKVNTLRSTSVSSSEGNTISDEVNTVKPDGEGETDIETNKNIEELKEKFQTLECEDDQDLNKDVDDVLVSVKDDYESCESEEEDSDEDDEDSWITPSNVAVAKKQINSELMEEKNVEVACMTTDFAMQNVLRQMNLNVSALDGRMIKQLRTYILRCYTCFGTTSLMTKIFCPKCGNNTLKKVAVSLDEDGKQQIHINAKKPLTGRGKRFSMPTFKGGKHANNPVVTEDQPMPRQRPSRLARTKNNPLDDDYIAGFSPFVMRDVNSRSAQLCIRPGTEVKHWMRKNPNEARRHRKK